MHSFIQLFTREEELNQHLYFLSRDYSFLRDQEPVLKTELGNIPLVLLERDILIANGPFQCRGTTVSNWASLNIIFFRGFLFLFL